MTTASTSTVIDHSSDAGFRTWVAEIITMLFTTLGVTQTTDTGQINTTTVTRPATSTMAGYVIGRFNDTLQGTSPIFFKLQFGTGGTALGPQMNLQLGTGSNGSGTLTGTTSVVTAQCPNSNAPTSTVTPFVTRACYNTTDGVLWLAWKLAGTGTTNLCMGGFEIARSNDTTGAASGDAVGLYTNNSTASGQSTQGVSIFNSYLTSTAYSGAPLQLNTQWGFVPFSVTGTLFSGNTQVFPVFQYTPVMGVTNWSAMGMVGEVAVGATASLTLVGSTAHTYIAVGSPFGLSNFTAQGYSCTGGAGTTYTMLLPWE